jgi:enamine deaminase RidA (YjgF/YER057c/UK114 family)
MYGQSMTNEHPYPAAFRSGDLVSVSGRLGVTGDGEPYGAVVEVEALARVRDV